MTTNKTHADGTLYRGKWTKLSDGSFGAQLRVGGRGADFVGSLVIVESKAGKIEHVQVVAVEKDWGRGDVVDFRVSRTVQS